jgi:hypothetical protein
MRLKPIKWKKVYGKPKNNSLTSFKLTGEIDGLLEGEVEGFYITNNAPYNYGKIKNDTVYLCRSVAYRYGRRTHTLRFKTIKEAKSRAQEIGTKLLIKKYFIKGRKLSRKVLVEKTRVEKTRMLYENYVA